MIKTNDVKRNRIVLKNSFHLRRFFALVLVVCIFMTALPKASGEMYSESYLSLYFADATMEEGKTCGYTEQFFANIAAISMMDLQDQSFLAQYAQAVGQGYNYRVFVMHEKGMPDTDFALLYCFEDSSWLMKNTTSAAKSVYIDASWQVMEGMNIKLKKEQLIQQAMLDCDDSYECDAEYVCQIFMEFFMFIEARNQAFQQMLEGTSDTIPELPEEIDSWPLVIPVSVQLPKELNVLEALFTVEPAASAAATFQQIPESQHYEGTVNADNVVTGSLSFWEAGPHLIRCVFTVSLDGHKQSMSHNISIDTSNVRVKADKNCPVHESGHQWKFEWAEAHPHYGRLICDCGAEQDAPDMPTVTMPSCCECLGSHDWAEPIRIGNAFQHTCLRCGLTEEMTPPANVQSFYTNLK